MKDMFYVNVILKNGVSYSHYFSEKYEVIIEEMLVHKHQKNGMSLVSFYFRRGMNHEFRDVGQDKKKVKTNLLANTMEEAIELGRKMILIKTTEKLNMSCERCPHRDLFLVKKFEDKEKELICETCIVKHLNGGQK